MARPEMEARARMMLVNCILRDSRVMLNVVLES